MNHEFKNEPEYDSQRMLLELIQDSKILDIVHNKFAALFVRFIQDSYVMDNVPVVSNIV